MIMTKQHLDHFNHKKDESEMTEEDLADIKHTILTSMRKLFHLLICVVYLTGLFYDRQLLFLCSFGMFIVLALAEVIA